MPEKNSLLVDKANYRAGQISLRDLLPCGQGRGLARIRNAVSRLDFSGIGSDLLET